MQLIQNRFIRAFVLVGVAAPALAACAAVGGGGDQDSDCQEGADVSGSEFTPQATASYSEEGTSCNNNEFVDTDLDAYAYPAAEVGGGFFFTCDQGDGEGASATVYRTTSGFPQEVLSTICDGQVNGGGHDEGDSYVVVIEHPASSGSADFELEVGVS